MVIVSKTKFIEKRTSHQIADLSLAFEMKINWLKDPSLKLESTYSRYIYGETGRAVNYPTRMYP